MNLKNKTRKNSQMLKSYVLIQLLIFSSFTWAAWPTGFGGVNDETMVDMVTSSSGNTYLLGQFQGSAKFDGIVLNSVGLNDIYITKLDQGGNVVWAIRAGGSSDDIPKALAVDEAENVYIVGSHYGVSRFGSAEFTTTSDVKNGFLAKINANGSWVWAKKLGKSDFESEAVDVKTIEGQSGIVPPVEGSVYVTGYFRQQIDIDTDSGSTVSFDTSLDREESSELYVVRYEHDGDYMWADYRRNVARAEFPTGMDVSDDGILYISGNTTGITSLYSEDFDDMSQYILNEGWSSNWNPTLCPDPTAYDNFSGEPHYGARHHDIADRVDGNNVTTNKDMYLSGTPRISYSSDHLLNLNLYSPVFANPTGGTYQISFDVREGQGPFSEPPDEGENLDVWLESANGAYAILLQTFLADGTSKINGRFTYTITGNTFPTGARLRFRKYASSGSCYDAWHVDNIEVGVVTSAENFVFDISNASSLNPDFNEIRSISSSIQINDIVFDNSNNRLIVSGESKVNNTLFCEQSVPAGTVLASFDLNVPLSDEACQWVTHPSTETVSTGTGVTVDNNGLIYQTGYFTGPMSQTVDNQCSSASPHLETLTNTDYLINGNVGSDVFLQAVDRDGVTCWLTGGGEYDDTDGFPAIIGDIEIERGLSVTTNNAGSLFVSGQLNSSIILGQDNRVNGEGGSDVFITNWGTDGRPFQIESWPVGTALIPPPTAITSELTAIPDFYSGGIQIDAIAEKMFLWQGPVGGAPAQLIPLRSFGEVEVHWRVSADPIVTTRVITSGVANWPSEQCDPNSQVDECYQLHASGAPVEIEPSSGEYLFMDIPFASGNGTVDNKVFNNSLSGFSTLVYIKGPSPDVTMYPIEIEVVRTVPFNSLTNFDDNVAWEIGKKVTDSYHNEIGRTGYVLNELAYYDGTGVSSAYNRSGRTGQIIPVNRIETSRPQDVGRELSVAWYKNNSRGVYWPDRAVRYSPQWPTDPDKIIIASQFGGEGLGQDPLDPLEFPSLSIYIQSDPSMPGFNPNDEHAIFAPSNTGSGHEAIFALRADFGSELEFDSSASSDPYVLIKYYDEDVLEWKMRVYQVLATGAGYDSFQFTGVAATTVSPPYPVRLLPSCSESRAVGQVQGAQPPPPFFQDYKAQIWAKSAGSGELMYYYPLQPGFFYDLNNNDIQDDIDADGSPDLDTTCIPWLARLEESRGGTANPTDPIKIRYDITWPSDVPQLVIGETLLTPKRGLPDIVNQAAVQVVYDDLYDSLADPLPSETLAQMIDPITPRFVRLGEIPEEVASELQTNGLESILGSADGTVKLPAAIKKRISFDPLNNKLILTGIFDETGAGEPLLLPNVLSKRDRVALKQLNGGDGSEETSYTDDCSTVGCDWDQAVEALFRLSRNPNGIEAICTNSNVNDDNTRTCNASNPVTEDDVLIGFQDLNGDYVLEPFVAVGAQAAFTAGNAQGSGFMTVAFNNDPALTPLPVSLNIIRVDCLQSPPPPVLPGDAEIYSSYQGQLQVIAPENIFDEQIVLRHSGDFGGNPDVLEFEWFFHPDTDGTPPMPLPDPESGQLNGWIKFPVDDPLGANEITIAGANIQTLSDNWYVGRYRGLPACDNASQWSLWAGQPGATPINERAQLAEGWVKRVLKRLNPFEARVQNFAQAETNNYASMLIQLGERYEGDIAMNNDPDNLNSIGLIEAYTTVMRRAMSLSVDSTPPVNYEPANNAILLVASRLVDFYTLLGNEAYADAQDPMIGITTEDGVISLAPTIFNFQNQLDSLLSEELVLLRGRDDSQGPVAANPVYNRLFWNFTTGDGEVAYALSYNISDQNSSGVIDEFDARIQFPQGHGDAWGHYLTATDVYYDLLKHPFYSWNPRAEAVTIAGAPIQVDFLDERQFAETAAAKARTGTEIVDLTYRSAYVEDPAGQYQGYVDSNPDRAWGVSGWAHRAGMGAYFDWVTANAIIPSEDPDPTHVGIQKIERGNIMELNEIAGYYLDIQGQIDEADRGLNPLGLASDMVPFDIDPAAINNGALSKTHFEQVYKRAEDALNNVISVWDFANQINNLMRQNQDSVDDIASNAIYEENDFNNQLIEIFGMPYDDDIGPGGTYPSGYDGPDLYHYMYIDTPALAGTAFDFSCTEENSSGDCTGFDPSTNNVAVIKRFTGTYSPVAGGVDFYNLGPAPVDAPNASSGCGDEPLGSGCALGTLNNNSLEVEYQLVESDAIGTAFYKPENWTGSRRAVGRLQEVQNEMVQARIAIKQAMIDYDILRKDINAAIDTLRATFEISESNIDISNDASQTIRDIEKAVFGINTAAAIAHRTAAFIDASFETTSSCIPKSAIVGLAGGGDLFSAGRCAVQAGGKVSAFVVDTVGDGLEVVANGVSLASSDVASAAETNVQINDANLELYNVSGVIDELMRREPALRAEIYARTEAASQLIGKYNTTLTEGLQVAEKLVAFRRNGAAAIQEYRYEDMAFRIFRNDALQKYRAAFDQAAKFVYMAAAAYDYETNLLGTDSQAGQSFLTDIVRERSIGQILNGEPVVGSRGLADAMARMKLNFDVLKGQMGFNNPQVETNRFSLRYELFRIANDDSSDEEWRRQLEASRVNNLWDIPEFRRYARPFAPEEAGPQPGLVITFDTNVLFGLNFFGNELGPNDSAYDSSQFSTRIRGVGTWFEDYAELPLANTPRMYLIPIGADVMRSPNADDFSVRQWQILDQVVPVPLPLGASDLDAHDWLPSIDNQIGNSTDIRRYSQYLAHHFTEPFDESQIVSNSRLVGRSVWNRKWMMIIPGASFLNNPGDGLDTFIHGQLIPNGDGERDGNGVDDIHLFFTTYSYSGN